MKDPKELKKNVSSRIIYCFGELCTVFVLSVGGISSFILACMIAAKLLFNKGYAGTILPYVTAFLVSVAALIILVVAAVPFRYGVSWYRIQQIRGVSVHARSMFSCYTSVKKLWKVIRLQSLVIIKSLPIMIPAALVSAAMFYISGIVDDRTQGDIAYYIMFFLSMLVTAVMIALVMIYSVRYSAVPYLFALGPDRSIPELIDGSRKIMLGKEKYISEVMFSLSMWLIPCLIIFPMIFIVPYIQMVYTAALNEIIVSETSEEGDKNGVVSVEIPLSV